MPVNIESKKSDLKIKNLFHKDNNDDKENQEISFVTFLTEKLGLFDIGIKRDDEEIKEYILTDPDDSVNLGKKLQVPREDSFAKSVTELLAIVLTKTNGNPVAEQIKAMSVLSLRVLLVNCVSRNKDGKPVLDRAKLESSGLTNSNTLEILEGWVQKEYKKEKETIFDKIINHISNSITDGNGKCLQEIFKDIKKSLTSFIQDICAEYLPEDKTSKLQNELQKLFNKNLITSVENAMNVKEGSQASEKNVAQAIKEAITSSAEKTVKSHTYKAFLETSEFKPENKQTKCR
jgi:hypothetical protein